MMASLATLVNNSSSFFGKKAETTNGLDILKKTNILNEGLHENVKILIKGKIIYTTQLSKTFYICTLECLDIMCNTKNVDVIIKGEDKVIFFKDYVKKNNALNDNDNNNNNNTNNNQEIIIGGFVEILRDDFKTPVIHAIFVNHISLKTKEIYNEINEAILDIDIDIDTNKSNTKNNRQSIRVDESPFKKNKNIKSSSISNNNIKNNVNNQKNKKKWKRKIISTTTTTTTTNNKSRLSSSKKSHWKPKKNERRAAKFVNFLIDEFGYDYLKKGIILDIAGGKGEVAFESSIRRGLQTVVIDPRPVKTTKKQIQQLKFRLESQLKLTNGLKISPLARFLYHKRYAAKEINSIQGWFYEDFATNDQSEIDLIENASILIGLHPDSATDAIMKVAIRYSKPFAIVPCCVFPTQFPKRRLPNGQSVQTYDDFCEYIRNIVGKNANGTYKVEENELEFEGRNKVFFYHGPSSSSRII